MKTWWGLAAAALSLVIIVLGYAAMTAGLPTVERLARNEADDGIDVPAIGTVGDFPDPRRRHVVNVSADGRIRLDGKALTFEELAAEILTRAALSGTPMPGTTEKLSEECFLIRADGALPWGAAFAVYRACAEPRCGNILFGVRHAATGDEGAVAAFLPILADLGEANFPTPSGAPSLAPDVRVIAAAGTGTGWVPTVHATFAEVARRPAAVRAFIEADPRLPTRTVLEIFDATLRAGLRFPMFDTYDRRRDGAPRYDAARAFAAAIAGERAAGCDVTFDGCPAAPAPFPSPLPEVAFVRGRLAGVTWGHDHAEPRFAATGDGR